MKVRGRDCRAGSRDPAGTASTAGSRDSALQRAEPRSRLSGVSIGPAKPTDRAAITALLRDAGLPHEDFEPHLSHFIVARRASEVVGSVGAEICGADALLRSFVVAPILRGAGLGGALLRELEARAAGWGVERWWLLTTTADAFFRQRGFRSTPRDAAPAGIAATAEFRGLCPSVAVCLSRERRSE